MTVPTPDPALTQTLTGLLSDPAILAVLAALILTGLPNALLARLPIVGPSVQAFIDAWARKRLLDFAESQKIVQTEAERIVRAKEQLIKTGRLDQGSAKAQAMKELVGRFADLSPASADQFIESEVNKLCSRPVEIVSTLAECTFPTCGCEGACEGRRGGQ